MVDHQVFPLSDWQLDDCWRLLKLRGVRDEQMPEQLATIAVLATQRAHSRPQKLSLRAWLLGIVCEISRDEFASLHRTSRLIDRVSLDSLRAQPQTALATVSRFLDTVRRRT